MVQTLTKELSPHWQWALPESLEVPPDELKVRLDFYTDSIILYLLDKGVITTKQVSARDISLAILSEVSLNSGLLPREVLWWKQSRVGAQIALWRPPKIWTVALQEEPFQPARRFKLPLPGLIFLCSPGQAPAVYAVKKRPQSPGEFIYHAPLFNVYDSGMTCAGTVKYPQAIEQIPEAFFAAFFTEAANTRGRSQKYPEDLLKLWMEIDGKAKYPLKDLVKLGIVADLLK
jgi:PRTRC genetic system protein B